MGFNFLKDVVAPAGKGDIETVKKWLAKEPLLLDYWTSHGRTMIWEASYKGKLEMVKFLVNQGADIEALGCHMTPHYVEIAPYCVAAKEKRDDVQDYLLSVGAKRDIHTAAYLGDIRRINELLDKNPKLISKTLTIADWDREKKEYRRTKDPLSTPLKYAIANSQVEATKLLIERGAQTKKNFDSLLKAVHWVENAEIAKLILPLGLKQTGDLDKSCQDFETVLRAFGEDKDINESDRGWPELVYICRGDRGGNPDEVKTLLKKGARVDAQNYKGKTALHCASRSGFIPAMKILIEAGADVDAMDHEGNTPIFDAISSTIKRVERKVGAVELLIESGASLTKENKAGKTPHSVAQRSQNAKAQGILKIIEEAL